MPAVVDPASRDALFDHLIESREVMTYADATRVLVGGRPVPDRNFDLIAPLIALADAGPKKQVRTLLVNLDALLVNPRTRQPSESHFLRHPTYSLESWVLVFRNWTVCRHVFPLPRP